MCRNTVTSEQGVTLILMLWHIGLSLDFHYTVRLALIAFVSSFMMVINVNFLIDNIHQQGVCTPS